jgi:ribonucleoside-diphosphate reductase alpha chain
VATKEGDVQVIRDGLTFKRYFTREGVHPFDEIEWEQRDAVIPNFKDGGNAFEQRDVEFPVTWSQNATNIVAQKYFRGPLGTPQRESSVRQLVGRVVDTITGWGIKDGYFASGHDSQVFAEELAHLLVTQKAAFNSPVWFNLGVPGVPSQASACFILAVDDQMSSILNWYVEEGTIFKGGSGSGINLSKIRSSKEQLAGGGTASGPVSFMRGADASAGTIKSGGKTRRAAKMVILNVDHPDVHDFIWCKAVEERKARVLRDAGFDMDLDGKDSHSTQYQNANNSVRVTDEFMKAYEQDQDWKLKAVLDGETAETVRARALMREIAEAAWECADPGMQYDTTINEWHTCPATGRINASNPCCFIGDTLIETNAGAMRFELLQKAAESGEKLPMVRSFDAATSQFVWKNVLNVWVAGSANRLVDVGTSSGASFRCTPEHRFLLADGPYLQARDLFPGAELRGVGPDGESTTEEVQSITWIPLDDPVAVYDLEVAQTHNFCITSEMHQDGEGIVVHNSEYMHLDNSACNLASLNLLKFLDAEGTFDVKAFRKAVDVVFTAQEIVVGNSDYPTDTIAMNARAFRQLGLGYANLGALLMARGLAYDSDGGRAWAGAITALMTGQAYRTSARIAEVMGPFDGYEPNADAMLRVMRNHRAAADEIDGDVVPEGLLSAAKQSWDDAIAFGTKNGYRNAQATVLAPTGCLIGSSLVPTERGLVRLDSLGDPVGPQWQDLDIDVATDEGPRVATKFYVNGLEAVVDVETARGHLIRGTPRHRVKVVDEDGRWVWKRFSEIREGDRVPLALHQLVGEPQDVPLPPLPEAYWTGEHHARAPRTMTPELAELVGYFMGDGSLHARGIRLCVDDKDLDVVERLRILGKDVFGLEAAVSDRTGYTEVAFNSVRLVLWWEACRFAKREPRAGHTGKGYVPHIPNAVLHSNDREVYSAFLRGLFEADGTVTAGYPNWSTTSLSFSRDVQALMLALGFPTSRKMDVTGWGRSALAVLRLLNASYNVAWLEQIGFISERKNRAVLPPVGRQSARHDKIPVSRSLIDRVAPENTRLRKIMLLEHGRSRSISRRIAREVYARTGDGELGHLLDFFYDEVARVELGDDELTYDLSVPDNVTYVANGFVSHNTIGLMMDCDTTGIEPELALVKTKKLVGGGTMQFVNQTVPRALDRLGYDPAQVEDVVAYIAEHNSVAEAPHLRPEHYPVFDTAMGAQPIHYMGHVRMMAAAQPFLSGAISKTVNMPEHATVEEVEQLFVESWKLGLKAVAIYRDNCKVAQPLSADKKKKAAKAAPAELATPVRKRLPRSRPSRTISFQVGDAEGYITAGEYPDDGIGEIFLKTSKQGSTLSGVMDAFAIAVSLGLQYGVPLEAFVSKFINMKFEPSGMTNDPDVRFATSLVDYVFRRLALDYLSPAQRDALGIRSIDERKATAAAEAAEKLGTTVESVVEAVKAEAPPQIVELQPKPEAHAADAPLCYSCGSKMQPAGSCYVCPSCGSTSGCS